MQFHSARCVHIVPNYGMKIFLLYVDQFTINFLQQTGLTLRSESLMFQFGIKTKNYIEALSKILLQYSTTQPFNEITVSAYECLELIIPFVDIETLYKIVFGAFNSAKAELVTNSDFKYYFFGFAAF